MTQSSMSFNEVAIFTVGKFIVGRWLKKVGNYDYEKIKKNIY